MEAMMSENTPSPNTQLQVEDRPGSNAPNVLVVAFRTQSGRYPDASLAAVFLLGM